MIVIMIILLFLIGAIPPLALFFWLRGGMKKDDGAYQTLCVQALRDGVLCSFVILLVSLAFNILEAVTGIKNSHPILREITHTFIVLAFSEELVKYLTFKRFMKKHDYAYSWLDMTVFMTIIGMGFGVIENLAVAIDANPIVMLIRGITIGHGGYGFIMGYFMGKAEKTGKKMYVRIGFLLPWLLHGAYDCGLSQPLNDLNDNIGIISVFLAFFSLITIIIFIIFFAKARKNEVYTSPLHLTGNQDASAEF